MKNYLVFLRDGNAVTVKADSIAKMAEGMVLLQSGQGEIVAAFTIAEISGIALEESVVSE
ncbi:MAG: hypothetical protein EOP84_17095 [Verrucomicrobiaceae bacterium]|nr:MAG: hypothetical protein EOP84_17095 [Verrucomicrobiaceae bacterium]